MDYKKSSLFIKKIECINILMGLKGNGSIIVHYLIFSDMNSETQKITINDVNEWMDVFGGLHINTVQDMIDYSDIKYQALIETKILPEVCESMISMVRVYRHQVPDFIKPMPLRKYFESC